VRRLTDLALLTLALAPACAQHPAPVSLVLLDIVPVENRAYTEWARRALDDFTRETGIAVERQLPPQFSDEQLALERRILEGRGTTPDVFLVDAIAPGTLADHLLDLSPQFERERGRHFPGLVANNVVRGRLVAIPYHANVGILLYRTDLLHTYGLTHPPASWDELASMAAAIQAGERRHGRADFWGYVWQGAPYEGLTCNALEWQASEGGGRILEDDGAISVNNPRARRAWARAASWIGTISPPEVIGFREVEAEAAWLGGRAAFLRSWPGSALATWNEGPLRGRFDIAPLPAGAGGRAGTLGENALAVSRYSAHPTEAIALVRYLSRADAQRARSRATSVPPTIATVYEDPGVLAAHPYYSRLREVFQAGIVSRPSAVAGDKYAEVSRSYFRAVHSVLTREKTAETAGTDLERELEWITGLRARTGDDAGAARPAAGAPPSR
jgi:trehalose/maltose transport system substrate-binding protein